MYLRNLKITSHMSGPIGAEGPKQPSAGARKRGAWVPWYSNLQYLLVNLKLICAELSFYKSMNKRYKPKLELNPIAVFGDG